MEGVPPVDRENGPPPGPAVGPVEARADTPTDPPAKPNGAASDQARIPAGVAPEPALVAPGPAPAGVAVAEEPASVTIGSPVPAPSPNGEAGAARASNGAGGPGSNGQGDRAGGCTTAQLRRFIKSRAYVPIHEIRRRFLIATEDDDVSAIDLDAGRVFVGLPSREGQMLGELLRGGEVGYELQLDPVAPVVVGVYPMRPVSRG